MINDLHLMYEKLKSIHTSVVYWLGETNQFANSEQYRKLNMIQNQIKDLEKDLNNYLNKREVYDDEY